MKKVSLLLLACLLFVQCKNESSVPDVEYSQEFNSWTDKVYDEFLSRSPISQSYQGIKDNYGIFDDMSEAAKDEEMAMYKGYLKELADFDVDRLEGQAALTHRLLTDEFQSELDNDVYRHYNYPAHQMRGVHDFIPSFMINIHKVADKSDAEAYISRLKASSTFLDQAIEGMTLREQKGVMPPQFVYPHIIGASKNIVSGYPFQSGGENSPLYADLEKKIEALEISDEEKQELIIAGKDAMMDSLLPSYERLISFLEDQQGRAVTDDGVWKFNNGGDYYTNRLAQMTTTDMTADDIFNKGMSEVERIHEEMRGIMKKVGFEGDLQDFFEYMRTSKEFYYPNTAEGKQQYLDKANEVIADMKGRLDGLFITKPKADLIVKAVEPFREKAAGKAFYQGPAPDGSRPGTYYANLYDMASMPTYQLEALAYHEALPGHHMQIAIKQELEGLPKYRTLGLGYTAYSEGWGLYSEYVPKELGLYEDPYSDFGRLAMELWRSCRMVVDAGIHHKKWTREDGIAFYKENTPNAEADCVKMVERHIVMPGQATAYKVGQLKILELRDKAKNALGEDFDIREFHDVVLTSGAVPLTVLEELVDAYIAENE